VVVKWVEWVGGWRGVIEGDEGRRRRRGGQVRLQRKEQQFEREASVAVDADAQLIRATLEAQRRIRARMLQGGEHLRKRRRPRAEL
jgi:hypothetical protein